MEGSLTESARSLAARPSPPSRWARLGLYLALPAVLACAGYGFTLRDFFLADDFSFLLHALRAKTWSEAAQIQGWTSLWFRPITFWSWWLEAPLFGVDPFGYRATNLLLHVANAGLLALFVERISGRMGPAAVAGAAFAALPTHAEAVTWICARFDALSALGIQLTLLSWMRWASADRPRRRDLALAAAALLFAAGSKEIGLGALLFLPIVTLGFVGRPQRRHWLGYAALCAVGAAWFALRWSRVGGIGGIEGADGGPALLSFDPGHIARFLLRAFRASFAPVHAARFPSPWHPLVSIPAAAVLGALAITARAGLARRFARLALPLFALFLVALLPAVTWAHLGTDNQGTRFLYVPTLFSCAILGLAFLFLGRGSRRTALGAGLAAVAVGAWLLGLVIENRAWHEAGRLARTVVDAFPSRAELPHNHVAVTDMPDNHEGAMVFRSSFSQALTLFGEPRLVHELTPGQWEGELRRRRGPIAFLRWDADEKRWVRARREPRAAGR